MTSFLELIGDECDNLTFMNYEIGSFKIRKNSRILGSFKIRNIRILDPWLYDSESFSRQPSLC